MQRVCSFVAYIPVKTAIRCRRNKNRMAEEKNLNCEYAELAGKGHIKKFCQYFTPSIIADFMCRWVLEVRGNLLDPAAGNMIFFKEAEKISPGRHMTGYEIDPEVLSFFSDFFGDKKSSYPHKKDSSIILEDFLTASWDSRYECIICNPPYGRFQHIENKEAIFENFEKNGEKNISRFSNESVLFLIKSIHMLSAGGRLCFIIPSEFMNSSYGRRVRNLLVSGKGLRAVVNFSDNKNIFSDVDTTCCIVLFENRENSSDTVKFINVNSADPKKLEKNLEYAETFLYSGKKRRSEIVAAPPEKMNVSETGTYGNGENASCCEVSYEKLSKSSKWSVFFYHEENINYKNIVPCSSFFRTSRGIATGANSFFLFSEKKMKEAGLSEKNMKRCICSSKYVNGYFFTDNDFDELKKSGKNVYIFSGSTDVPGLKNRERNPENTVTPEEAWIRHGEETKVNRKYLPSHRSPWYRVENIPPAPILASAACRGKIKIIRNLSGVSNLTSFHGIYVKNNIFGENKTYSSESFNKYSRSQYADCMNSDTVPDIGHYTGREENTSAGEYKRIKFISENFTDILFSCLISPCVKKLIMRNRKILGSGLERFQPNDLNDAMMPDLRRLSLSDAEEIISIYNDLKDISAELPKDEQTEDADEHVEGIDERAEGAAGQTEGADEQTEGADGQTECAYEQNECAGEQAEGISVKSEDEIFKKYIKRLDTIFSRYIIDT